MTNIQANLRIDSKLEKKREIYLQYYDLKSGYQCLYNKCNNGASACINGLHIIVFFERAAYRQFVLNIFFFLFSTFTLIYRYNNDKQ